MFDVIDSKKNKIFFFVFVAVWAALVVWNFLVPRRDFSEAENRSLAQWPDFTVMRLLDGDYMDDVNTFFNDQFAGRDWWVSSQSLMEVATGKREVKDVYIGDGALLRNYAEEDTAISDYNLGKMNELAAAYGKPTYFMLVPSSTGVQPEKLPPFADEWDEGAYIAQAYAALDDAVTTVDVFGALRQHQQEYVFYRSDHHWTTYGAFLGYQQLAPLMGLPQRGQTDFEVSTLSTSFWGTNQWRTGYPLVKRDTMEQYTSGTVARYVVTAIDGVNFVEKEYDSIYFDEYLARMDKYSYFLGSLQPGMTIFTNAQTDRKLLVIKDSYAHCLVPMLLDDYSEIRLLDFRSNIEAEYVEAEKYDDILLLMSTDVFAHQRGIWTAWMPE